MFRAFGLFSISSHKNMLNLHCTQNIFSYKFYNLNTSFRNGCGWDLYGRWREEKKLEMSKYYCMFRVATMFNRPIYTSLRRTNTNKRIESNYISSSWSIWCCVFDLINAINFSTIYQSFIFVCLCVCDCPHSECKTRICVRQFQRYASLKKTRFYLKWSFVQYCVGFTWFFLSWETKKKRLATKMNCIFV